MLYQVLSCQSSIRSQILLQTGPRKVKNDGKVPNHGLALDLLVERVHDGFGPEKLVEAALVHLADIQVEDFLEHVGDVALPAVALFFLFAFVLAHQFF